MYNRELEKRYFNWLTDKIGDEQSERYSHLLHKLHETNFWFLYSIPLDGNRYEDGINLRYRFGEERGILPSQIAAELDIRECSMLEMLVALSIRIEEAGMGIPYEGIDPGRWFWQFVENLGYFASPFDDDAIDRVTDRFLNRQFNPDGSNGGIVVVEGSRDLRRLDIWYQIQLYLSSIE